MARGFWLAVGVVIVVAMVFAGTRWYAAGKPETASAQEPEEACYPLQRDCRWQTADGEAIVRMTAVADEGDEGDEESDELILEVTLPDVSGPVIVVLTGENMYMGEYPLRLETTATPDRYRTRFVPPFCSTGDDMVWRISLRTGQAPINLPFRLVFPAAAN